MEHMLCVDFGSAYTKVGVRSGWKGTGSVIHNVPIAVEDPNFCIPSAVVRVKRRDGYRWLIGRDAAEHEPDEKKGDKVYQHWKARLFTGGGVSRPNSEFWEVAVEFFRHLLKHLCEMKLPVNPRICQMRLCIPQLTGDVNTVESWMREILIEAGWVAADNRVTVAEPEASVCGVLTDGRNAAWYPGGVTTLYPRYGHMFHEGSLFGSMRNWALGRPGSKPYYSILAIDVGAFTTDFAHVKFEADDLSRPAIIQHSEELGVRELDYSVRQELSPKAQSALTTKLATWEGVKQRLYNGKEAQVTDQTGDTVRLGHGPEAGTIQNVIQDFASRLVRAMRDFCRKHRVTEVGTVVLTGGGTMIATVRRRLAEAVKTDFRCKVYDLHGASNPNLVRGGSAIGGCSVFFDLPSDRFAKEQPTGENIGIPGDLLYGVYDCSDCLEKTFDEKQMALKFKAEIEQTTGQRFYLKQILARK